MTSPLSKQVPLHEQVETLIRSRIVSGELPAGTRLPSTAALADELGASVFTIQRALSKLTQEGLLDRKPRQATWIRGEQKKLTSIAAYFGDMINAADTSFPQVLWLELKRQLGLEGIKIRHWIDTRSSEEITELPRDLLKSIRSGEVQALIVPHGIRETLELLKALPIPYSTMTTDMREPTGVSGDQNSFLKLGLEQLKRQGCRTIGAITNYRLIPEAPYSQSTRFYQSLMEAAGAAGLQVRNEWVYLPEVSPRDLVQYGYRQFHALWNRESKPDGLLIFPDKAAMGVVTAILERRIEVPKTLKLAVHMNDLLPYPCPMAATLLVTRVESFAKALITQIKRQLENEPTSPIAVPYEVREILLTHS